MKEIVIRYKEIDYSKSNQDDALLMERALDVSSSAYAPYSKFKVGAALLLENKKIIIGNNQENASFPCGICAERVALFSARTNYPNIRIEKIAITAFSNDFKITHPVGPCGLCRQVLLEYEESQQYDITILLFNKKNIIKIEKAKDLLPFHFYETRLIK